MANERLTVWCNATYTPELTDKLRKGLGQHELIFPQKLAATNLSAGEADPNLSRASVAFGQPDPNQIISRIYQHALGRDPNPEERQIANDLLKTGAAGLEDLLWAVFLSPEFQFIS